MVDYKSELKAAYTLIQVFQPFYTVIPGDKLAKGNTTNTQDNRNVAANLGCRAFFRVIAVIHAWDSQECHIRGQQHGCLFKLSEK
jgi:hypothetical protein